MAQALSLDGDVTFITILAGELQGDTLVPYLFTTCLDYSYTVDPLYLLILIQNGTKMIRHNVQKE